MKATKQSELVIQGRSARVPASRSWAFTLIELLVVMLVIVILGGIILGMVKYVTQRVKNIGYDTEKDQIHDALDDYRSTYGEYPIPGNPKHYAIYYITDPGNISAPFNYWINLADNPVEVIPTITGYSPGNPSSSLPANSQFYTASAKADGYYHDAGTVKIYIDYKLTYPLMLRQQERNEPAIMSFPQQTIVFLVLREWNVVTGSVAAINSYSGQDIDPAYFLEGAPMNRAIARSARTGQQWDYQCENGINYTLGMHY